MYIDLYMYVFLKSASTVPCCPHALSRCSCIVCTCVVCSFVICPFVSASVSPPFSALFILFWHSDIFNFFWYVYVWCVCGGWGGCAMCVVLTCACDIAQRSRVCARESLGAPHVLMLDWLAALCTRRHVRHVCNFERHLPADMSDMSVLARRVRDSM